MPRNKRRTAALRRPSYPISVGVRRLSHAQNDERPAQPAHSLPGPFRSLQSPLRLDLGKKRKHGPVPPRRNALPAALLLPPLEAAVQPTQRDLPTTRTGRWLPIHDVDISGQVDRQIYRSLICAIQLVLPDGSRTACIVYRPYLLGWICTTQILHDISYRLV